MKLTRTHALAAVAAAAVVVASGQFLQHDPRKAAPSASLQPLAPDGIVTVSADYDAPVRLSAGGTVPGAYSVVTPVVPRQPAPVAPLAAIDGAEEAADEAAATSGTVDEAAAPTGCPAPALALQPMPDAMIGVVVVAPCDGGARVALRGTGGGFDMRLPDSGVLSVVVPALARHSEMVVRLPGRKTLRAVVEVPGAEQVSRVALSTPDGRALSLNAYMRGEAPVSRTLPGWPNAGAAGYMTVLGDAALPGAQMLEVYTAPDKTPAPVRLEVQAELDGRSCGHDLAAEMIRGQRGAITDNAAITMSMPDCPPAGMAVSEGGLVLLPLAPLDVPHIAMAD